jgi:hypothetical protein
LFRLNEPLLVGPRLVVAVEKIIEQIEIPNK